jgi:hypothetical protein
MHYPVSDSDSRLHSGKFTDGNPSEGILSSRDKAAHMNAVYDELLAVITGFGLTPAENNLTQLLQAINIAAPWSQVTWHYVDLDDPDPVPGWLLCDGTGGTPDLLDRFAVGAGGSYDVGDIGGANTKSTDGAGGHSHTITVDNHTLTTAQMPVHNHTLTGQLLSGSGDTEGGSGRYSGGGTDSTSIQNAGGGEAHNHGASSSTEPNHSHDVDVRPPYFALAPFIRADYIASLTP